MAAYCKEQGLNYQTFTYHALCIKKKETDATDGNRFVQIKYLKKVHPELNFTYQVAAILFFRQLCRLFNEIIKNRRFIGQGGLYDLKRNKSANELIIVDIKCKVYQATVAAQKNGANTINLLIPILESSLN